jgi:hypothetical protein
MNRTRLSLTCCLFFALGFGAYAADTVGLGLSFNFNSLSAMTVSGITAGTAGTAVRNVALDSGTSSLGFSMDAGLVVLLAPACQVQVDGSISFYNASVNTGRTSSASYTSGTYTAHDLVCAKMSALELAASFKYSLSSLWSKGNDRGLMVILGAGCKVGDLADESGLMYSAVESWPNYYSGSGSPSPNRTDTVLSASPKFYYYFKPGLEYEAVLNHMGFFAGADLRIIPTGLFGGSATINDGKNQVTVTPPASIIVPEAYFGLRFYL